MTRIGHQFLRENSSVDASDMMSLEWFHLLVRCSRSALSAAKIISENEKKLVIGCHPRNLPAPKGDTQSLLPRPGLTLARTQYGRRNVRRKIPMVHTLRSRQNLISDFYELFLRKMGGVMYVPWARARVRPRIFCRTRVRARVGCRRATPAGR